MCGQADVVDVLVANLLDEPFRDLSAIRIVLSHAKMQRLGSAKREPSIEWSRNGAGSVVNELKPLSQPVVADGSAAADHVAVPVQVLGRRVVYDVRTKLEGALE